MASITEALVTIDETTRSQPQQQIQTQQSLQIPKQFAALNDCFNPPPTDQEPSKSIKVTQKKTRRLQIVI
jgi:hypothetical protein